MRRAMGGLIATASVLALMAAPAAVAAPADSTITYTSQQLTKAGYPKKPNVVGWAPGTVSLPTNTAAQWEDVIITGKAPSFTAPGQLLTMSRFIPSDRQGSGTMKPLNITAVVQKDRSFSMHFQLGMTGTYGYSVGYLTDSVNPEFVGFQFQFTTTGSGKPAPSSGSSTAVPLTARQLTKAGFTKTANTNAWDGTATLSTSKAPAGSPVTIKGTAGGTIKPGTVLTLNRFAATDRFGSGSMEPVGDIQTVVAADGTFSLTFEINERGLYGYDLLANIPVSVTDEVYVIEFQLKTT
ncbi:MAG: hypothetical protein GC156_13165 [Actinomycetales bacterium]|nr:hypothetical protein [Actinomycetales bacterium]